MLIIIRGSVFNLFRYWLELTLRTLTPSLPIFFSPITNISIEPPFPLPSDGSIQNIAAYYFLTAPKSP